MTHGMIQKFGMLVVTFLASLAICSLCALLYVSHVRSTIQDVNTSSVPITATNIHQVLHKRPVIFYNSKCSHCRKTLPWLYLLNKMDGEQDNYLDVQKPNNNSLVTGYHIQEYPARFHIKPVHEPTGIVFQGTQKPLYSDKKVFSTLCVAIANIAMIAFSITLVFIYVNDKQYQRWLWA